MGLNTPDLPLQHAVVTGLQEQGLQEAQDVDNLTYWKEQLASAPLVLALPTDRLRSSIHTCQSARQNFTLSSRRFSEALKAISQQEGVTLFMILLAAFQTLLFRYSGQDDICVGSRIIGHRRAKNEGSSDLFVNTLVLRTDLSGNPTFRELLGRVRKMTLEAYAHGDLPFEKLVEELHLEHNLSRPPLCQVMFILQNAPASSIELSDMGVSASEVLDGTAKSDLLLSVTEEREEITGYLEYDPGLFDAATIARMPGHLQTLLAGIVTDPNQQVSALPLLSEAERHQLLVEWNDTKKDYSFQHCIHQLIETQAEITPDAIAVICENEQVTYQELNRRANKLARLLVEQGVDSDVLVALLAERSIDFLITVLAIFKAGGVYLPLDPRHPAGRLYQVLSQSECTLVLTIEKFIPVLSQAIEDIPSERRPQVLQIETLLKQEQAEENLPPRCRLQDLAYVMYTSGSTGMPKGAMVEHRGMRNHIYAKIADTQLTNADIVAQNGPQCFDISIWQFFAALVVGGRVLIFKDDIANNPARLLEHVERGAVSVLQLVPSMLREIIQQAESLGAIRPSLSALRWMVPTGDALTADLCRQWLILYPNIPLLNTYGATECSDDQCHYPIYRPPPSDYRLSIMPIGRPISNIQAYVLDQMLSPVPIGVVGELYLGGIGVGRGYLHDAQRTAQSFIPDPFSPEPGARLYKTGDLARYLPDGTLEFLGRIDHQVKIRGNRIELGEIEMVLKGHQAVEDLVVVARKDGPGDQRLVAYVVLHKEQPVPVGDLQNHLMKHLPIYMIPSAFVLLEALPLNANGKIDRRALPAPERVRTELDENYIAPILPVHQQLTQIWEELLDVRPIGIRDNFFDLGGHSLLAARLMDQVEKVWGKKIPLDTLLADATIERLANVLVQPEDATVASSPQQSSLLKKKDDYGLFKRVVRVIHR